MTKRIGILTSGGDCAGLNAVIRAIVLHARGRYGWEVVGIREGTQGLLDRPPRAETLDVADMTNQMLTLGGTILGTTNKGDPFAYPMPDGSVVDRSNEIIEGVRALNLDGIAKSGRLLVGEDALGARTPAAVAKVGGYLGQLAERLGRGGRRRPVLWRARLRHRRVDPPAGRLLQPGRHEADLGPGQPLRRHAAVLQPRHSRPADPLGARQRPDAAGDRRRRRRRPGGVGRAGAGL